MKAEDQTERGTSNWMLLVPSRIETWSIIDEEWKWSERDRFTGGDEHINKAEVDQMEHHTTEKLTGQFVQSLVNKMQWIKREWVQIEEESNSSQRQQC